MNNNVSIVGARDTSGTCLDRHIKSFVDRLTARNYTAGTIKGYRVLIRRLAVIMEERGIRPEYLTVEMAGELVQDEERKRREPRKCANIARRLVGYLSTSAWWQRRRRPRSKWLVKRCGMTMRIICAGNAGSASVPSTIAGALPTASSIIASATRTTTFGGSRRAMSSRSCSTSRRASAPFRDKTPPTHLRNFFRYLFKCGLTSANLSLCVPSVAQRYGAAASAPPRARTGRNRAGGRARQSEAWTAQLCHAAVAGSPRIACAGSGRHPA